jgi:hypothetical protein
MSIAIQGKDNQILNNHIIALPDDYMVLILKNASIYIRNKIIE